MFVVLMLWILNQLTTKMTGPLKTWNIHFSFSLFYMVTQGINSLLCCQNPYSHMKCLFTKIQSNITIWQYIAIHSNTIHNTALTRIVLPLVPSTRIRRVRLHINIVVHTQILSTHAFTISVVYINNCYCPFIKKEKFTLVQTKDVWLLTFRSWILVVVPWLPQSKALQLFTILYRLLEASTRNSPLKSKSLFYFHVISTIMNLIHYSFTPLILFHVFRTRSICFRTIYRLQTALGV